MRGWSDDTDRSSPAPGTGIDGGPTPSPECPVVRPPLPAVSQEALIRGLSGHYIEGW
jgi:hypothetical protein